jgi:hypothetical protein
METELFWLVVIGGLIIWKAVRAVFLMKKDFDMSLREIFGKSSE